GWHRAGTLNLNIRYGQMTMALVAQAAIHQMRQRLGSPFSRWDAAHLAREIFGALEGDLRVVDDTILVTYYNAPHQKLLPHHYETLSSKLRKEASSQLCHGSTASSSTSASDSLHPLSNRQSQIIHRLKISAESAADSWLQASFAVRLHNTLSAAPSASGRIVF